MTKPKEKKATKKTKPCKVISSGDMAKAEQCARDGCQNGTIEGLMGWSENFIINNKRISGKLLKKRQERKLFKRRELDGHAEKTPIVAIFQAKNELGMSDKTETKHGVAENLQSFIKWLKDRENG